MILTEALNYLDFFLFKVKALPLQKELTRYVFISEGVQALTV